MKKREKTGELGEELYNLILSDLGFKPLRNIYLPLKNGNTTEIDMLIAHPTGIYPIEVKNYGARIYGNDKMKYWKAYYNNGKGYNLYNPILQNDSHRRVLERVIGFPEKTLSFVVFTDRADLSNVQNSREDVLVCNPKLFKEALYHQILYGEKVLTIEELKKIHKELSKYIGVDDKVKKAHIKYVKKQSRK
jgi:hypothetical protein